MASSSRPFPDFPEKILGDLAWTSADFASEHDFTDHLSADGIAEINAAVKHFLGTRLLCQYTCYMLHCKSSDEVLTAVLRRRQL